jgi:hypothetical protein
MASALTSKRNCTARFSDPLSDAGLLQHVLSYVSTRCYLYIGAVSRLWKHCYEASILARMSESSPWLRRTEIVVPRKTNYSAAFRSVATLTWAYTSGLQLQPDDSLLQRTAGERASLLVLALLHELGLVFGERALVGAVISQREDIVDYLRAQHSCPFAWQVGCIPARKGNTSMLRCLKQNSYQFKVYDHKEVCSITAHSGHLDTLRYLRSDGCSWSTADIAGDAARSGNIEMVSTSYAAF